MPRTWTIPAHALPRRALLVAMLLAVAAFATLAAPRGASATTTSCANPATLLGSAFEIDTNANLVVNTTGCIDWLSGGAGTAFRDGVEAKSDQPTGANDDSFGQGTAEDNPNPTIVTGSIPPNKSDLKAFGVYTEADFLELFWSRVQNPSGTTNMDFELNKVFCDGTATNCANNGTAKAPVYVTPKRSTGDKLITYDLSRGGTVPTISIRTWSGSTWGSPTLISGGSDPDALGSINTTSIAANATGGLGAQDPYTFGEAGISFEALFGTGACGTFGSAYLKSRSSDSFTAEIKDFVAPEQVNISNCPSGITTTATGSVVVGNTISDTAHLTVGAGAGGSITFHLYSDAACTVEVTGTGLLPVAVNGPGDYSSGSVTVGVGTYYWIASYSGDLTNDPSTGACGDANETSVVTKIAGSIATSQFAYLNDTAAINGSGDVRFRLYAGTSCSGTTIVDQTVTSSAGAAATTNTTHPVSTSGTYSWLVEWGGDATHTAANSSCGTENTALTFTNG